MTAMFSDDYFDFSDQDIRRPSPPIACSPSKSEFNYRCNYRCPYCYVGETPTRKLTQAG